MLWQKRLSASELKINRAAVLSQNKFLLLCPWFMQNKILCPMVAVNLVMSIRLLYFFLNLCNLQWPQAFNLIPKQFI